MENIGYGDSDEFFVYEGRKEKGSAPPGEQKGTQLINTGGIHIAFPVSGCYVTFVQLVYLLVVTRLLQTDCDILIGFEHPPETPIHPKIIYWDTAGDALIAAGAVGSV